MLNVELISCETFITPTLIGFVFTVTNEAFAPMATHDKVAAAELSRPLLVEVKSTVAD